jgi:hypothetical protein
MVSWTWWTGKASQGYPMARCFCMFLLCMAIGLISFSCVAEDAPVIKVNPVGQPLGLAKGNAIRYFLWYDKEGWHLRSDTGGRAHVFSGTISVVDGQIITISNFERMEAGAKKPNADLGSVNNAKNEISFRFKTSLKRDGFDFQLNDVAKEVRFKLLIDGKPAPERVLIGPASQPAPTELLVFPGHPD